MGLSPSAGNLSQSNLPPRSTQPGHPSVGRRNKYRPKGGNALWLGIKGRYGSCLVAGKTVWILVQHVSYLSTLEAKLLRLSTIQIHDCFSVLYCTLQMFAAWQENPFANRICVVFSTKPGTMNFTEFLNMLSVFSVSASRDIKSMYAFKLYGMNTYCVNFVSCTFEIFTLM